jgi:tRNA(fMet)-specific endonuclease VapC
MIRWLLDTDHASLQERGHPILHQRLKAVAADAIAVSAVTVQEMLRGRLAVLARKLPGDLRVLAYGKLVETVLFFSTVRIVAFDRSSEEKFQELRGLGVRIGSQDLRIASIALVNDLAVVTRNWKDFQKVPGLTLEDWSSAAPGA